MILLTLIQKKKTNRKAKNHRKMESSKNKILNQIKESKLAHTEQVFSISESIEIYKPILPDTLTCFKNELESINGQVVVFESEKQLFDNFKQLLKEKNIEKVFCREEKIIEKLNETHISHTKNTEDFEAMQGALTSCEFLIARTGSVVVTSAPASGRQLLSYPPVHFVLADVSQIVNYPEDAYNGLLKKYEGNLPSQITTITGPSRTADIEKTLVLGAHGPKEFIVLLCKEKSFNNFAI